MTPSEVKGNPFTTNVVAWMRPRMRHHKGIVNVYDSEVLVTQKLNHDALRDHVDMVYMV